MFHIFSIESSESASDSDAPQSHRSTRSKNRSSNKSASKLRTPNEQLRDEPIVVNSEEDDSPVTISDDEARHRQPARATRHQTPSTSRSAGASPKASASGASGQPNVLAKSPRRLRTSLSGRKRAGQSRASPKAAPSSRKKPLRLVTQLDGAGDSSEEEVSVSSAEASADAEAERPSTPPPPAPARQRQRQRRVQFAKRSTAAAAASIGKQLTSTPLPVTRSLSLNLLASPIGNDAEADADALSVSGERERLNSIPEAFETSDHEQSEGEQIAQMAGVTAAAAAPTARRTILTNASTSPSAGHNPQPQVSDAAAAGQPIPELLAGEAAAVGAPRFLSQSHMRRRFSNVSDLSVLASSFGARDSTDSERVPLADASRGAGEGAQSSQAASASSDSQHLVIMCVELLCECRGVQHPDPSADAILGVFYCVYVETDAKYVCGAVLQLQGANPNLNLNPNSAHTNSNTTYTISIPNLPDTSAGLLVREAATELQVITEFLDVLREYDPDVLLGYEIERMSWSYLLERASALGLRSIRQLVSRLALPTPSPNAPGLCITAASAAIASSSSSAPGHSHSGKQNASASASNSLLRVGAVPADGLVITGRVVLNLWRLLHWELSLTDYGLEAVALKVLHERYPLFAPHETFAWFIDDSTRY